MSSPSDHHRWIRHTVAQIKLEIPAGWEATHLDDKTATVASPDGVSVELRFFSQGTPEAAHDEKILTKELEKLATEIRFTRQPAKFQQHGLDGFGAGGVGRKAQVAIAWSVVALGNHHGRGVVALVFGAQIPWIAQAKAIAGLMESIQPLK